MARPSLQYLTSKIQQLIAEGLIEEGIEQLKNYLHSNVPALYNEIIVQASRYRRLLRSERSGMITTEQFNAEQNRIARALLALLDEIPSRVDQNLVPLDGVNVPLIRKPKHLREGFKPEKILGINNLKQISWIERGLEVSRSVCRILTPNGLGTGFLVGPQLVMTNNHVLPNETLAAGSQVEFNYQQDGSGKLLPAIRYHLDHAGFHTNPNLDYTLVGVKPDSNKPALQTWGQLQLNPDADPVPDEHVCIIQHPNGGLKQIVLTSNWVEAIDPPVIHYTTDTMPGSSGSPVFNDTWHVVALHHASVPTDESQLHYINEGILMSAIKADAGSLWPQQ
jgi:V8-like Glu-specific endopeptidase